MRALVTGAAGFIGSRLAHRLLADGHEVVGLDDLSEGKLENLADSPQVDLVIGDLRDPEGVLRAARGSEVVFHQGALRSVLRSMKDPQPTVDVNVRGTANILMAARDHGARVVAASSSSVYGDQDVFPLEETMSPRPKSPYAATKLASEVLCQTWMRAFGVPTISLRYFNVYGPFQDPMSEYGAVVPLFIDSCLSGKPPVIEGDGEQARDFTYIDDVVEANVLAAQASAEAWGMSYNIGGGREPVSVNRLLALIAEATGTRPTPVGADPRPGDVRLTDADVSLAGRLLGYRPATDIAEGTVKTVAWFRESGRYG